MTVDEGIFRGRDGLLPADVPQPPVSGGLGDTRRLQVLIGAKLSLLSLFYALPRPSPLTVGSSATSILQT